ncbi:MAG: flavodoxin family protein [Deltaproteobacteria bacterium]|nr:flavodoxin family protein [Deltaproteobacteria bacterium]
MKVVAFNGSARKDGNTAILVNYVLAELEKEGISTELVQLAGKEVRPCIACRKCFDNTDQRCAVKGDYLNTCLEKMIDAHGIILASPTYFADLSAQIKALIDRAGYVGRANQGMYRRKVGAAVVAVRRAGSVQAFDSINHFFLYSEMIVPSSSYWNIGIGKDIGDVENDAEGIETMKTLGQNMAWLMKKIYS